MWPNIQWVGEGPPKTVDTKGELFQPFFTKLSTTAPTNLGSISHRSPSIVTGWALGSACPSRGFHSFLQSSGLANAWLWPCHPVGLSPFLSQSRSPWPKLGRPWVKKAPVTIYCLSPRWPRSHRPRCLVNSGGKGKIFCSEHWGWVSISVAQLEKNISFLLFCDDVPLSEISLRLVSVNLYLKFFLCPSRSLLCMRKTLLCPLIAKAPHNGRSNPQPAHYPMRALEMGTRGRRQWKKPWRLFSGAAASRKTSQIPASGSRSSPTRKFILALLQISRGCLAHPTFWSGTSQEYSEIWLFIFSNHLRWQTAGSWG